MTASQVTIGAAIRYAWSLLSKNWRAIWGALALNGLAATVWAAGDLSQNPTLLAAAVPGMLMTTIMAYGAMYRLAFADRHADGALAAPAHHGLQWGAMEWRMLGSLLLTAVFIGFLLILGLVGISIVLAGVLLALGVKPHSGMTMQEVFGPLGLHPQAAPALVLLVLLSIGVYLGVRLSLALPATADQRAVRVLRTWKLTRGKVWPLFAAALLIQLPVFIVGAWFAAGVMSMDGGGPAEAGPTSILIAAIAIGAPMGLFVTPMLAGVYAHFYRATAEAPVRRELSVPKDAA
jgi:hypothetical protein